MKFHCLDSQTQNKTPFTYTYGKGEAALKYRIIKQVEHRTHAQRLEAFASSLRAYGRYTTLVA